MKKLKQIVMGIITVLVLLLSTAAVQTYAATTLKFVQTPTITLYASISASATSARLTPYPKDLQGNKLTISNFGSNPTFTVDPKVRNVEEIISFTGIVDNGDNTATLTGLTRNLSSVFPYTTLGTGRQHAASAIVVFSNNPQMYSRLAAPENDTSITGLWLFSSTTAPRYDFNPSFIGAASTTLASIGYVASTSYAGTVDANDSTKGIVEMATLAEAAAGTSLGSTGARAALGANLSTSTPYSGTQTGSIVATVGRYIAQAFIDLSATFNWSGLNTFTGGVTSTGTTTISASSLVTNPLVLNTLPYIFPSSRGASSSVLTENGSGTVRWITPQVTVLFSNGAIQTNSDTSATTTWQTVTLPVGTLTTVSSIDIQAFPTGTDGGSGDALYDIIFGTGSASTTIVTGNGQSTSYVTAFINLQSTSVETFAYSQNGTTNVGTAAHSSAGPLYIAFRSRAGNAADTTGFRGITVKLNRY